MATVDGVSEWTIENFSCWNVKLHGNFIKRRFNSNGEMKLYPRGVNGLEEHMAVWFSGVLGKCEISLTGPDGSIIWNQKGIWENLENPIQGPKFEEVVSRIRQNETKLGDLLTLLIRSNRRFFLQEERALTIIDVFDTALKLDASELANSEGFENLCYWLDGEENHMCLRTIFQENITELQLYPLLFFGRKIGLRVKICVMSPNNDATAEIYEEKEHLLKDTPWTIFDSPKIAEMQDKFSRLIGMRVENIKIILQVKIVYGSMHTSLQRLDGRKTISIVPRKRVVLLEAKSSECPMRKAGSEDSVAVLTKDFMSLFQDNDFSDFQLKCDNVTFPVHKNILSARSPVFKTMLSSDMAEAATGTVDITDLDPSTLCLFLTYLYTGFVEEMQGENAPSLYYAADKYQVTSLKMKCTNFLSDNVSISNVCNILSLAHKHEDEELTNVARWFILNHFNEVSKSEEWKSLVKTEPLLVAETVTYFGEKDFLVKRNSLSQ